MGGAALGAPGEQIKEGEEGVAGTTFDEPDAELRGPPPQPEGLREKGLYAALARPFGPRGFAPAIGFADSALFASRMVAGLHGVPAPRCAGSCGHRNSGRGYCGRLRFREYAGPGPK